MGEPGAGQVCICQFSTGQNVQVLLGTRVWPYSVLLVVVVVVVIVVVVNPLNLLLKLGQNQVINR